MDFGVHLPQVGPLAGREGVLAVARKAEELGFHSLWVSDHVVIPRGMTTPYPGRPDGRFPVPPEMPFLEPLATLLFAAAATERIRLGTSVLVITVRNPVLTAKQLATLDVLSGGRLILGAGAGWLAEEFQALDMPFGKLGPRMNEYLEVIRRCWTEDDPSFEGRFYRLGNVGFYPKPLQRPHPRIWVGGWAQGALRRAARYGDAWHAGGPPSLLGQLFARVKEMARQYGRDPERLILSVRADDGLTRRDPQEQIELLRAYRQVGASHVLLAFPARTLEAMLEGMERFAREVAGKV